MEKKNMLMIVAQHLRGSDLARATENILSIGQEESDGGPGSGNFGHAGRKGKRGGSAKHGTGSGKSDVAKENEPTPLEWETKVSPNVKKSSYRNTIRKVDSNKKVARGLYKATREILSHRDSTNLEDMAFINASSGEYVVNKDHNVPRECVPNSKMYKKIKEWGPENTIILHNHPKSTPPSTADINLLIKRGNKYGVIACHNGTIMKYQITGKTDARLLKPAIDTLFNVMYNYSALDGKTREQQIKETLERMKRDNFEMEVYEG